MQNMVNDKTRKDKQIINSSVLDLGGKNKIKCYVTADGTRVLDQKDLETAFPELMDEMKKRQNPQDTRECETCGQVY
jgi:hypothetical protein